MIPIQLKRFLLVHQSVNCHERSWRCFFSDVFFERDCFPWTATACYLDKSKLRLIRQHGLQPRVARVAFYLQLACKQILGLAKLPSTPSSSSCSSSSSSTPSSPSVQSKHVQLASKQCESFIQHRFQNDSIVPSKPFTYFLCKPILHIF